MNAEVRLGKLLCDLAPQLHDEVVVFCALDDAQLQRVLPECLCLFREREGVSAILPRAIAEREDIDCEGEFRQITLQVYSSLDAVGLTAVVAGELAEAGISANMVAALRHDHIFVPSNSAQKALQILRGLSSRAQYS